MTEVPTEVRRMLSGLIRDFERQRQTRELAAIHANPRKHKSTMLWGDKGLRWRYFELKKPNGQTVRFCWSTTRNAAGYFASWREVHFKSGKGERYDFAFRKVRLRAKALAEARYTRMKGKLATT